ncbi:TIM-barrel domain-containing protein [Bacillus sp. EAC]|uniref:glycoside hydrolase family 31 protein n=1 Tax=Bacillus sp. EAC TaxID=1978338 RepID=UPI000B44CCA2|nr:TIM-barrel domain-containing protein [Bacillus sp. EAC]
MLENSSFSVKPELFSEENQLLNVVQIQQVTTYSKEKNMCIFTVNKGKIQVEFPRADIVRITVNHLDKNFTHHNSSIENYEAADFKLSETDIHIVLKTSVIEFKLDKQTCQFNVSTVKGDVLSNGFYVTEEGAISLISAQNSEFIYGLGEKSGWLNKKGERLSMWNTDVFAPHTPDISELYESIPTYLSFTPNFTFGCFLNNTGRTIFDFKNRQDEHRLETETGIIDLFVYTGPSMKNVLEQHTFITGRPYLPPKWALGYHQSRHSYQNEEELKSIVSSFEELDIPVDAIYLDILYMDGYRVFTFDKERFPNYETYLPELLERGIHIVPIVDPGVKVAGQYDIFIDGVVKDAFTKMPDKSLYIGDVWPGKSALPDFSQSKVCEWWGDLHEFYTKLGIKGIWNDMNEPAIFNESKTMDLEALHDNDGNPISHKEYHNLYGYHMSKATSIALEKLTNERPFVLTRAGYAGIQKYAAVWTGDNRSFWEHLAMTVPMCLNLGLSGVTFSGPDVGGFMNDTEPELLTRWIQMGTFLPYFRNHCSIGMDRQEPWVFGDEYTNINREFIQMRYEWMPFLYQQFIEAEKSGMPIMRPLVLEYANDSRTYDLNDEYLIGENLLVAPIVSRSVRSRSVYLPEGNWINYWTNKLFEGGKDILVEAPLHQIPLFIREGSIVPLTNKKKKANQVDEELIINVYSKDEGTVNTIIYEDDGITTNYKNGERFELHVSVDFKFDNVNVKLDGMGDFKPSWKKVTVNLHGTERNLLIEDNLQIEN